LTWSWNTQWQTNARGYGYNSFFCYTKRPSVWGQTDLHVAPSRGIHKTNQSRETIMGHLL